MAYFNYRNLDSTEFEAFTQDVMQRLLGCKLYRYAQGTDGGIDLCDDIKEKHIVVQCKRYQQGTYNTLYSVLKREEKPKIDKLNPRPERYYLFTSLELLAGQKAAILDLFKDYMNDESCIVDGIVINDFFRDEQNHDLIARNIKLFRSFPVNYDVSTGLLGEGQTKESIEQVFKVYLNEFEDHYPSFGSFVSKYDITGFIIRVIVSFNGVRTKKLSKKTITSGVLASILRSAYLYEKYEVLNGNSEADHWDNAYSAYANEISVPIEMLLDLVRTSGLSELSKQSNRLFLRRENNNEEQDSIAFVVLCLFFADLFWIISKYPAEHADMIRYKTNADVCQKLSVFTKHVSFQNTQVILDSSKRRIDICLFCDEANSHKAAALFVNEFERFLGGFEDIFAHLNIQFYYVRASILSVGQDRITNHNFEAYTPTLMPLLSGGHLYSSHLTFIRELTQNSIDSISVRRLLNKDIFDAKIKTSLSVDPDSGVLSSISFNDDGMGMGKIEIERYLTSIGRSYYTTRDFKKLNLEYSPISYFGIGFLSCFLVCKSIEIVTRSVDDGKSYRLSIPNIEGCFLSKKYRKMFRTEQVFPCR